MAESPLRNRSFRIALVLATSTGGVGRHVASAARGLAAEGHQVAVLGPAATERRFGFSSVQGNSVRFRAVEIASGFRPLVAIKAAWMLRRLVRGSDVVHAHGFRAALVTAAALGRWRHSAPGGRRPAFVVTLHNAMLGSSLRRRLLEFAMRQAIRGCDAVLVVSPDLAALVCAVRPDVERALVASALPAPAREAAAVRSDLGIASNAPMVLAIGRLHRQKGFDVLVGAAAQLRSEVTDAVVVIAGDGPQRPGLQRQIAAAGVDVRLIGHRSDVSDLVHAADVVVMPSRWEGWPMAAAEVLGVGRPLVAAAVGGLPELVADAAFLVPPEDPSALAAALVRVLTDVGLATDLAVAACRRAAQLPTDEDVVAQLVSCYSKVVNPWP